MRASPTISLFSEQHELNRHPYSILFSALAHLIVVGLIILGIVTAPRMKPTKIAERYVVRHLDLDSLESEMQSAREEVKPPQTHTTVHAPSDVAKSEEAPPPALRVALQAPRGKQTLIQPDIPKPVPLNVEIPVPKMVIWSGKPVQVKTIVAPPPAKPMVTNFKPSVLMPNDESNLAEVPIPTSALSFHNRPVLTGTTSPIVVSGPKPTPPAPLTSTKSAAPPTPAAILSLSEHHMDKGAVNLPPVNSSAMPPAAGSLASANPQEQAVHQSHNDRPAAKASPGSNVGSGQASSGQKGVGLENYAHAAHFTRPKDGQFGSVVVGSALEDRYPEMADLMGGKMSYSVYVPVGLPKNWVLQYSLPNAGEGASSARLEAPWPYDIIRPNIAPGSIDADALMVHGYINLAGHFEALTIAFPPQYAQAQFVLSKLSQWQFRPATQNGQNVKVEILLIIPEIEE